MARITTTTRGIEPTRDFLRRANRRGREGTEALARALRGNADLGDALAEWAGFMTDHVRYIVSDEQLGPQIREIVTILVDEGLPFEVRLKVGWGAVVFWSGPSTTGEEHMVVVIGTNTDMEANLTPR